MSGRTIMIKLVYDCHTFYPNLQHFIVIIVEVSIAITITIIMHLFYTLSIISRNI